MTPPSTSSTGSAPTKRRFRLQTDPFVFFTATIFVAVFVAGTIAFGSRARDLYSDASDTLLRNFAWLYIGGFSVIFVFLIGIFVSKFGKLRLGDDEDEPEFSLPVWFAMLFAAGLGATLLFWGAAEPIHHAYNPPRGELEPMSQEAVSYTHLTLPTKA